MMVRSGLVLAVCIAMLAVLPAAEAHLLYDGSGQWVHVRHGRGYPFYNGASQSAWWDACRSAQVN